LFNWFSFIMKNNKWTIWTSKNQSEKTIWFDLNFSIAWSFEQSEKYSCSIVSISSWKNLNERDEKPKINQQKQFDLIKIFQLLEVLNSLKSVHVQLIQFVHEK
jgi:hypothetical protein